MPRTAKTGLVKCRKCQISRERIRNGSYPSGSARFIDERGHLWSGTLCRECSIKYIKTTRHKSGRSNPYGEGTAKHMRKGRASEIAVKEFFERLGNKVTLNEMRGPDLIIDTGNKIFTCEVKTVVKRKDTHLMVDKVALKFYSNDYIAYVFGNQIHITTMKEHLAACPPGGQRSVTKLFNVPNTKSIS